MSAFPPPWRPEKIPGGYAVRDAEGKVVAHIYGQEAPVAASGALTLEEAKEMATLIAKLPSFLPNPKTARRSSPKRTPLA
jgi:hypothetical protein